MARKKKTATKKVGKVAKVARRGAAAKKTTTAGASKSRRTAAKGGKVARRARRSREAIMAILEEAKSRGSNAEVIRKHDLSPTTFYSWKRKFPVSRRKRTKK